MSDGEAMDDGVSKGMVGQGGQGAEIIAAKLSAAANFLGLK